MPQFTKAPLISLFRRHSKAILDAGKEGGERMFSVYVKLATVAIVIILSVVVYFYISQAEL